MNSGRQEKRTAFGIFCKALPVFAAALVMLCIYSRTADAAAVEYPIWIGGTQVTSDNAGNILNEINPKNGEPTASYDADTLTLTLNGVHITPEQYWVNDAHKDWNDPFPDYLFGGDYYGYYEAERREPVSAVYSMFFGPILGRKFDYGKGGGNRGNIVIKGENVIDGYGVGILAGQSGKSNSVTDPNRAGVFSIIGDGTLRINQLYSEKDGVPAPHGALNILETPGNLHFGTEGGAGPKIICNGIKSGVYSGHETIIDRRASSGVSTADGYPIYNYGITATLYGDTALIAQGEQRGFDARFGKSTTPITRPTVDNQYILKDNSVFCARTFKKPDEPYMSYGKWGAFAPYDPQSGADHPYMSGEMILGTKMDDLGSWVVYGSPTLDRDKLTEAQMYWNLPIKSLQPDSEFYTDPELYVWGFTGSTTVYSVDVEWGAMTFQYENSSWDSVNHTTKEGRGWLVYDAESEKILETKQEAVNQVTVTNHSNADVYATLAYSGADGYTDTTGGFTTKAEDADTSFTDADAAADMPAYLTLATADNNLGEEEGQGKATVGTVYFMPEGIAKTDETVNDITKWTQIGTITVGLLLEQPK